MLQQFRKPTRWTSLTGLAGLAVATVLVGTPGPASAATLNLTQYVNPFVGTDDSNSPNPVPGRPTSLAVTLRILVELRLTFEDVAKPHDTAA